MKKIQLTKGFYALVDDDDFELISSFNWHYQPKRKTGYAIGHIVINGKRTTRRMHRMIMKPVGKEQVDHINGNGLDNRRLNLRITNARGNAINRRSNPRSGFKGVRKLYTCKNGAEMFIASIGPKNNHKIIGYFNCIIKAAKAYDKAALSLYGDMAALNFKKE